MSDNLILPSWLSRGIEEYFPIKGTDQTFSEIIDHAKKNNKKLRVKLGIDPTGTDIHLGHSILFKKLRAFQDNGPDQMFDQMNKTLIRMKDELDKTS